MYIPSLWIPYTLRTCIYPLIGYFYFNIYIFKSNIKKYYPYNIYAFFFKFFWNLYEARFNAGLKALFFWTILVKNGQFLNFANHSLRLIFNFLILY